MFFYVVWKSLRLCFRYLIKLFSYILWKSAGLFVFTVYSIENGIFPKQILFFSFQVYPISCSGHTICNEQSWHDDTLAQSLDCAEKQTPLFSLRATWQRLELCWHLSSLSGLILWLCSHGVRGKAVVAMATPVDGEIELWERRAEGGAAATHQHHNLSLSIILTPSKRSFSPSTIQSLWKSVWVTFSVAAVTTITVRRVLLQPRQSKCHHSHQLSGFVLGFFQI